MAEMKSLNGNEIVDAKARERLDNIEKNGVGGGTIDESSLSLGIASDGLVYTFIKGKPVGTGIPMGQSGDVFGYVDENNTVVLTGNLADGTYTIKYETEDADGNTKTIDIGDLVLDANTYHAVTSNLTDCYNSNPTKTVIDGGSYKATIYANDGYELKSVTVTMGGADVTDTAYSNGTVSIESVTGNIVIIATASVNIYSVTKNLTNCSISNSISTVNHGSSYSATITADGGYVLDSVTVTMNGSPVSVTDGVISIPSVTGDIVIMATATATAVKTYAVTYTYDENAILFNGREDTVVSGSALSMTVTAKDGYTIESITVSMNGTTETATRGTSTNRFLCNVLENGAGGGFSIISHYGGVTGDVSVTIVSKEEVKTYSITKNETNCTVLNQLTSIESGKAYATNITPNTGYELKSVTVTMGGVDITATAYGDGNIYIPSVTGDIVITAVAEEKAVEIVNLAVPTDATGQAAWESGGWCNNSYMSGSSYAYREATDGRVTTNVFEVAYGDNIYVKGINYAAGTFPQIALLNESGEKIYHGYVSMVVSNSYIRDFVGAEGDDYWSFKNDGGGNTGDLGIRKIRIAGYPSGSNEEIIITRNQSLE